MTKDSNKQPENDRQFYCEATHGDVLYQSIAISVAEPESINRVIERALDLETVRLGDLSAGQPAAKRLATVATNSRIGWGWIQPLCFSAAVVALIVSATWLMITGENSLAEFQDAVSRVRSVQYRVLDYHGNNEPLVSTVVIVSGVGSRSLGPDGSETITNFLEQKIVSINHKTKTATFFDRHNSDNAESSSENFFRMLTQLPASEFKSIGVGEFDGKAVEQYELQMSGTFVVSVDLQTKLPVHMELDMPNGLPDGRRFREVYTDFEYDVHVEERRFAIKAPVDYQVELVAVPENRTPVDMTKFVVSPKTGFGPLAFGSTTGQVIAALGQPDSIRELKLPMLVLPQPVENGNEANMIAPAEAPDSAHVITELAYPSLGFELRIGHNGLDKISCYGKRRMGDIATEFLGATDMGVRLGANISEVLQFYDVPEVRTHGREDVLRYPHLGVTFLFVEDCLAEFWIEEPLSDEIVVHDNGDGSWTESVRGNKD